MSWPYHILFSKTLSSAKTGDSMSKNKRSSKETFAKRVEIVKNYLIEQKQRREILDLVSEWGLTDSAIDRIIREAKNHINDEFKEITLSIGHKRQELKNLETSLELMKKQLEDPQYVVLAMSSLVSVISPLVQETNETVKRLEVEGVGVDSEFGRGHWDYDRLERMLQQILDKQS